MINNPTKFLFIFTLISGTLIAISANSWFAAWIGLEINLLSFIPLMTNSNNSTTTEAALKYFLIQAIASATLLFSIILTTLILNLHEFNITMNSLPSILVSSTLLLKTGAAPFHFWFPGVMEGLTWMNNLILMTWQKIAPLILLSYSLSMNLFTVSIIFMCMIIGALGGLNQTSLRKILAYSSINHLGWMIAALNTNSSLWCLYFVIYTFLSTTIIFSFNLFKLFHVNQIFSLNFMPPMLKFSIFTNFLSLGGLPPFLGFLPKWFVIQSLMNSKMNFLIVTMVILTLITLFYYLRLTFTAIMLTYSETIWNFNTLPTTPSLTTMNICSSISILGLLICVFFFQSF